MEFLTCCCVLGAYWGLQNRVSILSPHRPLFPADQTTSQQSGTVPLIGSADSRNGVSILGPHRV